MKALERCVSSRVYTIHSFSLLEKFAIHDGDLKTSFLGKVRLRHIDFCDISDFLVWKVNKLCRPAGKHIISSGPLSAAAEIIVEIMLERVPLE